MKINTKALQLIEKGLSSKTVSKLSESQINVLHSKLLSEQSTAGTTMVPRTDTNKINNLKIKNKLFKFMKRNSKKMKR